VCDEGLIIVATPYELDTNHTQIANAAAACKRRALAAVSLSTRPPAAVETLRVWLTVLESNNKGALDATQKPRDA
jgi:hypothetical protein